MLRALRLGDAGVHTAALADTDIEVRITAVRALVSVDAVTELSVAAADPAREVRVAVARGLAAVHAPVPAPLDPLLDDADSLVRGAALATTGRPPRYAASAEDALDDPAWQVRAGAATALRAAPPAQAVPAPAKALTDPRADVRKAAVLFLLPHHADAEARTALATATTDPDADIRAYASRAAS